MLGSWMSSSHADVKLFGDTLLYQQEAEVTRAPHQERTCWKWTYHCRVAGVEWGLDALLFSFSSSVKGKKKELPSVGKVKGFSALPKFPQILMIWKQPYFGFSDMLDFFSSEKKRGNWLTQKTLLHHFAFWSDVTNPWRVEELSLFITEQHDCVHPTCYFPTCSWTPDSRFWPKNF